MKKTVFIFFLSLFCFKLFSQSNVISDQSITSYRAAVEAYEEQNYGQSLKLCEDAIMQRKQEVDSEISILNNVLSAKKVRAAGDSLDNILKVLVERNEKKAISIINYYLKTKGEDFFNNSLSTLQNYIKENEKFPEAQRLIGDVYKLEGEYQFAEEYYLMALENKDVLDIPDEKFDILYNLADISRLEKNNEQYEVRLLNILTEDKNVLDTVLVNSMTDLIKADKKDALSKFFELYRADSYYSLNAYCQLCDLYLSLGENERALRFASLNVITGFTKIDEIIKNRNPTYEYKGINSFFYEASLYNDVVDWGNRNGIWQGYIQLAKTAQACGSTNFTTDLLKVLIMNCPEKYWQQSAVLMLENME